MWPNNVPDARVASDLSRARRRRRRTLRGERALGLLAREVRALDVVVHLGEAALDCAPAPKVFEQAADKHRVLHRLARFESRLDRGREVFVARDLHDVEEAIEVVLYGAALELVALAYASEAFGGRVEVVVLDDLQVELSRESGPDGEPPQGLAVFLQGGDALDVILPGDRKLVAPERVRDARLRRVEREVRDVAVNEGDVVRGVRRALDELHLEDFGVGVQDFGSRERPVLVAGAEGRHGRKKHVAVVVY